jgi:hypothetical protein
MRPTATPCRALRLRFATGAFRLPSSSEWATSVSREDLKSLPDMRRGWS